MSNYDSNYGRKNVKQPGGGPNARIGTLVPVRSGERSRKIVVEPCRPGPAKLGGNQPTAGMKNRQGR